MESSLFPRHIVGRARNLAGNPSTGMACLFVWLKPASVFNMGYLSNMLYMNGRLLSVVDAYHFFNESLILINCLQNQTVYLRPAFS